MKIFLCVEAIVNRTSRINLEIEYPYLLHTGDSVVVSQMFGDTSVVVLVVKNIGIDFNNLRTIILFSKHVCISKRNLEEAIKQGWNIR